MRQQNALAQRLSAIRPTVMDKETIKNTTNFRESESNDPCIVKRIRPNAHRTLSTSHSYQYRVAQDRQSKTLAYALALGAYARKGYAHAESDPNEMASPYDKQLNTLILLAENITGQACGTVTLVFDSPTGLPCDEAFTDDLKNLRAAGRRMAEVTRLALAPDSERSRMLLLRLFNLIYIAARRNHRSTDFIIEVHPRHAAYYRMLLGFEILGKTRPCPRVRNEPAVLLGLNLDYPERLIKACVSFRDQTDRHTKDRSLYRHFLNRHQESTVANALANLPSSGDIKYLWKDVPVKDKTIAAT